jgi:hypothetical protein
MRPAAGIRIVLFLVILAVVENLIALIRRIFTY